MIKKNFLNGLGTKLALAFVALTTATFTSCENEDFDMKVVFNPAEVNIVPDVTYIDLETGTSQDVTRLENIEYTNAIKEGNIGVIKGTEAAPSIPATTVTVKASYNGIEATKTINVSDIKTGKITYTATMILIKNKVGGEYTLEIVESKPTIVGEPKVFYANFNEHNYNHQGVNYYENPSEYIVKVEVSANIKEESKVTMTKISQTEVQAADLIKNIETIEAAYNWTKTKTLSNTFEASAYCLFYSWVEMTTSTQNIDLLKKEEGKEDTIVATFKIEFTSSSAIFGGEIAHPTHAGHYKPGHGHAHGHGHGHGNSSNAGGGIIVAD